MVELATVLTHPRCITNKGLEIFSMSEQVISATNLAKTYGEATGQPVLNAVNVEITKAEFTVVMGSSGAGKSTLLYCLSGMDRPSSGNINLAGHNIEKMSENRLADLRREHIGFVFQQINLLPQLTLLENICVAGYLRPGQRAGQVHERARQLLALTGMEALADRLPGQTSGGQQQRIGVARAMINEPTVLFADEPTGSFQLQGRHSGARSAHRSLQQDRSKPSSWSRTTYARLCVATEFSI